MVSYGISRSKSLSALQIGKDGRSTFTSTSEMTHLPSLAPSKSLPNLEGVPRNTLQLWKESAAVLHSHQEKLPFLQRPMPSRRTIPVGEDSINQLRREKMKINARAEYALRGGQMAPLNGSGGLGGSMRRGSHMPPLVASQRLGSIMRRGGSVAACSSQPGLKEHRRRKTTLYASTHGLIVHKKDAQQAALLRDQQFVMQGLESVMEKPEDRLAREKEFDDHWYAAMFKPIPQPREMLSKVFGERLPLPVPVGHSSHGHTLNVHKDEGKEVDFQIEEMVDIVEMCRKFAALTTPPDSVDGSTDKQIVLGRPAFCCLICAMSGFTFDAEAETKLYDAVAYFDRVAECIPVRGCSLPGGSIVGFGLSYGGVNQPELRDLPIIKMFWDFLKIMEGNVPDVVARFPDQKQEAAHSRLFTQLLPQAQRFAEEREEYLRKRRLSSIQMRPAEVQVPSSPAGSSSADSATGGHTVSRSASKIAAVGSTAKAPSRRVVLVNEESSSAQSDTEVEDQDDDTARESNFLYAHTFGVLKGEMLINQLLEPEVLHFCIEFQPFFDQLFRAYADIPMANSRGHMTLTAFLRFCTDFGIFPSKVDFQTLQWLYNTCECCSIAKVERSPPLVAVNVDPGDSSTACIGDPAKGVRTTGSKSTLSTSAVGSKLAVPRDSAAAGKAETEGGVRKRTKRKNNGKSPLSKSQRLEEPEVLWSGKWIRCHLTWLTKDLPDKSAPEQRSAEILYGMSDWLDYRRFQIADILTYLVPEKADPAKLHMSKQAGKKSSAEIERDARDADVVTPEVLMQVIDFMNLEDKPSQEELQVMIGLIKGTLEEIDIGLLKEVFMIIGRLKEALQRAKNCFLKDPSHMSQAEYSASIFFKELMSVLERNSWTPEQLFRKIDVEGAGEVDRNEMEREVRIFMKTQQCTPSMALSVEHPFDILDINYDDMVSREEFVLIFEQVKEAREAQAKAKPQRSIFISTSGAPRLGASDQKTFGCNEFVECLLKVGLVHLSFHGSAHQAEQNAFFKIVWLLLYLHWHFKRAAAAPPQLEQGLRSFKTPLQRLMQDQPDLFERVGELSPGIEDAEPVCWGNKADDLLKKCLAGNTPPSGHSSLNGQLLSLALS